MLTLRKGGFHSGAREEMIRRIRRTVAEGVRTYLFVPEQQTVIAEEEMAKILPPNAPLFFEVTNFPRFANTVFRAEGGIAGRSAGRAERALLMWKTLTELAPHLSVTKGGEIPAGTVSRMLGAVREMQSLAIDSQDLAELVGEDLGDRRLTRKIEDLSRVMDLYKRLSAEKFSDSTDELLRMAEKLEENPAFLRGAQVFFEGFTSFTEPQYRAISSILALCDVEIVLTIPKAQSGAFEYSEVHECERRLLRIADRKSVQKQAFSHDGTVSIRSELLADIGENLWRTQPKIGEYEKNYLQNNEELRIFEAENAEEMCDFVAADLKRKLMENPALRYADFAVVCRQADAYAGLLDTALAAAGIPVFFSRKREIASFEIIRMIEAAYATVNGNFRRADLIAFAKCPTSGMERDEVDELEIYAETWQITGRRFTDGIMWNMNPAGYSDRRPPDADAFLLRVDAARRKLLAPLTAFAEDVAGVQTVRDHAQALHRFLLSLDLPEKLAHTAAELDAMGEADAAMETAGLYRIVCDSLDTLCDVLGQTEVNAPTFLSLLKVLFSEADVGHIPAYVDCVTVGSADRLRLFGKKHVYLFGVADGEFPAAVTEKSFFSDRDKETLMKKGLPVKPDLEIRCARELYLFSRAFAFAQESVTLLYPKVSLSLSALRPAAPVLRIAAMTGGAIRPRKLETIPIIDRIFSPAYALEHMREDVEDEATARALSEVGYADRLRVREGQLRNARLLLSHESIDALYGQTIPLTQTRIERYLGCPVRYFCEFDLRLDTGERANFDARNVGSFVHAILEHFFREVKRLQEEGKRGIADLSAAEKADMIDRAAKTYLAGVTEGIDEPDARMRVRVARLRRAATPIVDSLCDEFLNCNYRPVFFELPIDFRNEENPDPAVFPVGGGRNVYIYGKIDRVDACAIGENLYLRVIDYKTGRKDFSPDDPEKGKNLQMFFYLRSLIESKSPAFLARLGVPEGTKLIPAGMIYVKSAIASGSYVKKEGEAAVTEESVLRGIKQEQRRYGMLLDDAESIRNMNPDFIPITYNKDGSPSKTSARFLYTAQGWERMMGTVSDAVGDVAAKMTSGVRPATPMIEHKENICQYCPYKPICRSAKAK